MLSATLLLFTALVGIFITLSCSFSFSLSSLPSKQLMQRYKIAMPAKQSLDENNIDTILTKARVDYSAANEYIRAHYNNTRVSQYFPHNNCIETIHDGRRLQELYRNEREMLKENGLAIIASPMPKTPQIDWSQTDCVQKYYLPELERIVNKLFPEKIIHLSFWNPMMRGESLEISRQRGDELQTPTANIASLVHIDTDVGAYESIEEVLAIIANNQIRYDSSTQSSSILEDVADLRVSGRKRFAILNFWRNIGETPITRAPLAIYSSRYDGDVAFPDAVPNVEKSKWYMFPNATAGEVIVFYQYDRVRNQPSDLWHCAIMVEEKASDSVLHGRKSFDIRAFIVLDEEVFENDRFVPERTRPILSFEESGCFCDEQAVKRIEGEQV